MPRSHNHGRHVHRLVHAGRPFRRIATAALLLLFTLFSSAVLISVAWNSFAPDALGLAELGVRAAAGVVLFVFTIGSVLRLAINGQWKRHGHRQ